MHFRRTTTALAVMAACAAGMAHADNEKMFSLSGFGTAGVAHSTIDRGDYVADMMQAKGAGYSRDWDIGVDSKVAVQLDARLTDKLSGVIQVMSRQRANNTFSPRFEWANLKYAFTPDASVRVGRVAAPIYLVSESRLVGYANNWIRPPVETYNLIPITNVDGIDGSYRMHVGSAINTVQAFYGRNHADIISTAVVTPTFFFTQKLGADATNMMGMNDTVELGPLTLRAGYFKTNVEITGSVNGNEKDRIKVATLGALYDAGKWFVQGEYTHADFGNLLKKQKAFYVTTGYRWNQFTPYVGYSQVKPNDNRANMTGRDQQSYSAGLRWDAYKNTAIKMQYDHVKLGTGNAGNFYNMQSGFPLGGSGNVISAAVDFIF